MQVRQTEVLVQVEQPGQSIRVREFRNGDDVGRGDPNKLLTMNHQRLDGAGGP